MKIAFIVGEFPVVSETFVMNQVADLIDRGIDVEVFSLRAGKRENISERFFSYKMGTYTHYLNPPRNKVIRAIFLVKIFIRILLWNSRIAFKALNKKKYGNFARTFTTLFWIEPFIGKNFDVVHCHLGPIANKYLVMRDILGHIQPFITTLYGVDVSRLPHIKPQGYYKKLIEACSLFLVMSENMKQRVIALGFPEQKIKIHPISIDVQSYPFCERKPKEGEKVKLISVGRFVEKKGFDDLLQAVALVKEKTGSTFELSIVGDGPLKEKFLKLAKELTIEDVVHFRGYMKLQEIIKLYKKSHLYIQSSKTASDGDME